MVEAGAALIDRDMDGWAVLDRAVIEKNNNIKNDLKLVISDLGFVNAYKSTVNHF